MGRRNLSRTKIVKKGWLLLGFLVIFILAVGYLAVSTYQEQRKREAEQELAPLPHSVKRHRIPGKRKEIGPLQDAYTAAVIPFSPREKPKMRPSLFPAGSVAIVIDDMGGSLPELDALTALRVPMTLSVIPQLPHAAEVAASAHRRGYEVMVHLPMEPQGYPQRRLENNGLLLSLTDEEIESQVRRYLELVPHAVGANNHMGSRYTEDSAKMLPVLQVLKERRFYFLDSKTTPLSVGYSLAHELGLKGASRNVFLDNVQEVGAIRAQLQQAARIARKRGSAVAIGHPHKATIEALSRVLPELTAEGITFVKLSQVVE